MATLRGTRRRILSIKSTQKITRAMEMVASVKMRKSRLQVGKIRPYAEKLAQISNNLSSSATKSASDFFRVRPTVKKIGLIVIGSDKGLCGAFNTNVCRKSLQFIREHKDIAVYLHLLGKKPGDFFRRRNVEVTATHAEIATKSTSFTDVSKIADNLLIDFQSGNLDEIHLIYNEFKSASVQKVKSVQLLPIIPEVDKKISNASYIVEPGDEESVQALLSHSFTFQIWSALTESYAAEQSARMAAMHGATKNAGDLIRKLTLLYNKTRQAAITKELLEVISGSESMK